jgi:ADP-ribose pyrophosphatase YjhB (NUDIX family)
MAWHHRLIGHAARLYFRIRRPRTLGVRAIVRDPAGRIALVRHTYADPWYLPGGGVKRGEGFDAALHRELREELGLADAAIERVLGVYHSRREGKDDRIVIFVASIDAAQAARLTAADRMEIEQAGWFALDALPQGVSDATLRRIAEFRAGTLGLGEW